MSNLEQRSLFEIIDKVETSLLLLSADDIYDLGDAEIVQRIKEDRNIERKTVGCGVQMVADYLCMWANTAPDGGLLAVGIEDGGDLTGCLSKGVDYLNKLESVGLQHCPDVNYISKRVFYEKGDGTQDFFILFRARYNTTKVVRNNKGQVFVRLGDNKHELKNGQIRELEIDKGEVPFEQENSNLKYPDDFNLDLIHEFAEAFRKTRDLHEPITDTDILEVRHLGKFKEGSFVPNNACVVLFARDPYTIFAGCRIRFLRFEGEIEGTGDRWNPQKDVWIDGCSIPLQIRRMEKELDSQLRIFTRLESDNKFTTTPEYPKYAWYEAIVNACVHRSYSLRNMPIFVKMFDDRIEIESPGGFPPFVTAQNIYTTHHPRNPHIFDAMQLLGFVRGAREGTRRMRESMLQMKLPIPEFVEREDNYHSVLVKLKNDYKQRKVWVDADAIAIVGEGLFRKLDQDEKRAINFVAENGSISVSDLQRLTQKTWPASKRVLENLKERGILYDKRRIAKHNFDRDTGARYFLIGR